MLRTSSSQLWHRQSGSLQLILHNVHFEKCLPDDRRAQYRSNLARFVQQKDLAETRRLRSLLVISVAFFILVCSPCLPAKGLRSSRPWHLGPACKPGVKT